MPESRPGCTLRRRGFTIIELLVVVSVIAILMALTGPSVLEMVQVQRLRGIHAQLNTDLHFARSEAIRLKTPMHVAVWGAGSGKPACYILFSDSNAVRPFSAACDCREEPANRCTAAATREVKSVQIDSWSGIDLRVLQDARTGIDPFSGTVMVTADDAGNTQGTAMQIEAFLDSTRVLRSVMDLGGVVRGCTPSGSKVQTVAC